MNTRFEDLATCFRTKLCPAIIEHVPMPDGPSISSQILKLRDRLKKIKLSI